MKRTINPFKRILLSVLGSIILIPFAYGEKYNLAINTADGNCTILSLQEYPSIIVENGEFTICGKESKINLSLNEVIDFSFTKNTESNITQIKDSGITISIESPDHLIISGLKESAKINITDINGRQISPNISHINSSTKDINLGNIPTGLYIISIEGIKNFKITRK